MQVFCLYDSPSRMLKKYIHTLADMCGIIEQLRTSFEDFSTQFSATGPACTRDSSENHNKERRGRCLDQSQPQLMREGQEGSFNYPLNRGYLEELRYHETQESFV